MQILSFQPEERLPMTMAMATISFVALDVGAEKLMIPSKVFYYMAAGSAVVGICQGDNELGEIVEGNECGCIVKPGEPVALATAVENLLDDPDLLELFRTNARHASIEKYSKGLGVAKFVSLMQQAGLDSHV